MQTYPSECLLAAAVTTKSCRSNADVTSSLNKVCCVFGSCTSLAEVICIRADHSIDQQHERAISQVTIARHCIRSIQTVECNAQPSTNLAAAEPNRIATRTNGKTA